MSAAASAKPCGARGCLWRWPGLGRPELLLNNSFYGSKPLSCASNARQVFSETICLLGLEDEKGVARRFLWLGRDLCPLSRGLYSNTSRTQFTRLYHEASHCTRVKIHSQEALCFLLSSASLTSLQPQGPMAPGTAKSVSTPGPLRCVSLPGMFSKLCYSSLPDLIRSSAWMPCALAPG